MLGLERLSDHWGYAVERSEIPEQEGHVGLRREREVEGHVRDASAHQT